VIKKKKSIHGYLQYDFALFLYHTEKQWKQRKHRLKKKELFLKIELLFKNSKFYFVSSPN
jgi:hypothetical protein